MPVLQVIQDSQMIQDSEFNIYIVCLQRMFCQIDEDVCFVNFHVFSNVAVC